MRRIPCLLPINLISAWLIGLCRLLSLILCLAISRSIRYLQLLQLQTVLAPTGVLYATFFTLEEGRSWPNPIHVSNGVVN